MGQPVAVCAPFARIDAGRHADAVAARSGSQPDTDAAALAAVGAVGALAVLR